jgi:hypothetical protein
MVNVAQKPPRSVRDVLCERARSLLSGSEPFFDGAPGLARLVCRATTSLVDWL